MALSKSALARQLIAKFPKSNSHSLASILYKENPLLFKDKENARDAIRYVRGNHGNKDRAKVSTNEENSQYIKPNTLNPIDPFQLPDAYTSEWNTLDLGNDMNMLVLADAHIPYHNKQGIELAVQYGKKIGVNTVLLNGDWWDCYACSFWQTDPKERDFTAEREIAVESLKWIRQNFKNARIIYKIGNHENRFERYLMCKAPELFGVEEFQLKHLLGFDNLGIELVKEACPILAGKLHIIHGHEYRVLSSNSVNAARSLFTKAKKSTICGHYHQSSHHSEKAIDDTVISCWSTGCLCNMHPEYRPLNNWNLGFATVDIDKQGHFIVENPKIINGIIYY